MGFVDAQIRTITCNGPECPKTITFDVSQAKQVLDTPGNEWMQTVRVVQTGDGRKFAYCSDACEIANVATGQHNLPQPKKIIDAPANAAAIKAAAESAAKAEAATAALKAGQPVTLS